MAEFDPRMLPVGVFGVQVTDDLVYALRTGKMKPSVPDPIEQHMMMVAEDYFEKGFETARNKYKTLEENLNSRSEEFSSLQQQLKRAQIAREKAELTRVDSMVGELKSKWFPGSRSARNKDSDEYRARASACAGERVKMLDCYRRSNDDPTLCQSLVSSFSSCAKRAEKMFLSSSDPNK
eukprot:376451_1